jgi:uncharacterized protein (TIGR03792 family)
VQFWGLSWDCAHGFLLETGRSKARQNNTLESNIKKCNRQGRGRSNFMVIEWLQFRVPPEQRERFIQIDEEIWTPAIAKYPGYQGKAIWISPAALDEVAFVIHWASREQWFSIPAEELAPIEAAFEAAIDFDYELLLSREYQVRRFPSS